MKPPEWGAFFIAHNKAPTHRASTKPPSRGSGKGLKKAVQKAGPHPQYRRPKGSTSGHKRGGRGGPRLSYSSIREHFS